MDESIHITNVSVQKRYKGRTKRHNPMVPAHNAWSSDDLVRHFNEELGKPNVFQDVIYAAIKSCLAQIAELSFKQIEHRNGR